MITARYPLYNNQGKLGYFDFSACLYPNGNTDNQSYFFNYEDVEKVYQLGFSDEEEIEYKEKALKQIATTEFMHFKIERD